MHPVAIECEYREVRWIAFVSEIEYDRIAFSSIILF